jgi:hypothetical protein
LQNLSVIQRQSRLDGTGALRPKVPHGEAKKAERRRRSDEPYSVDYFASRHDISREQARELMRKLGGDRDKLNETAAKLFRK